MSPHNQNISEFLSTLGDSTSKLEISPDLLSFNEVYQIQLQATNFLGGMSFRNNSFQAQATDVPTVTIVGSPVLRVRRSQPVILPTVIEDEQCGNSTALFTQDLLYEWHTTCNLYENVSSLQSLVNNDVSRISIPQYTLGYPGESCDVIVTLVSSTDNARNSTASITIEILSGHIVAAIIGGNSRAASRSHLTTLNASISRDLDEISSLPMIYKCESTDIPNLMDFCVFDMNLQCESIVLASDTLPIGIVQIDLNVSKGYDNANTTYRMLRYDTETILLNVTIEDTLSLSVMPRVVKSKYSPEDRLIIDCTDDDGKDVSVTWNVESSVGIISIEEWTDYFTTNQKRYAGMM